MARHRNANWEFPDKIVNYEQAGVAVLMDIRDELRKLNSLLSCQNFREIPMVLKTIRGNTSRIPVKKKEEGE